MVYTKRIKNITGAIKNIDFVLEKLIHKQKLFIYQIAKLEYKIYVGLIKLEQVDLLINATETNIISLNAAILAAGEGEVAKKLLAWITKEGYRLFKYKLRKNKIDVIKLVINQSKLEEVKQALITVNQAIDALQSPALEEYIIEYPISSSIEVTKSEMSINLNDNLSLGKIKSKSIRDINLKLAS